MKTLITAFEPFNNAKTNSSLMVIKEVAQREKILSNRDKEFVFHYPLPVSFSRSWPSLLSVINGQDKPSAIILMGQAEGRRKVSYERLALNWIDTKIPDNDGALPKHGAISAGGPEALWSQAPIDKGQPSIRTRLIEPSYSAGTYVCNYLFYKTLEWAKNQNTKIGFIHVPLLNEQSHFDTISYPERLALNEAALAVQEILLMPSTGGIEA